LKEFIKKRKLNIICTAAALLLILAVWLIAYYSVKNDYVVPSVSQTFKSFFLCFKQGDFWVAFGNTFYRTILSFLLSFLLAAVCAALSVFSKIFSAALKPIMSILRTVPTLAVILILLIWTTPKAAPLIVTVLVLFPMIYAQMMAAVGDIDCEIIEMAKVYSVKRRDRIFKIYLPLISPNILSQTGADISLGLKIMISAEVLANTYRSLGSLMQNAKLYVDMPRLAALTVFAVVLGLLIDFLFSLFTMLTHKWSRKEA